jgi:hypothetical protein
MSKIIFRGSEYDTIDAMPPDIRQAYQQQMRQRIDQEMGGQYESNLDHIPSDVQDIYDQVLGRLQEKAAPPKPVDNLPSMQDLFDRAAPSAKQNMSSDKNSFRPSPPLIDSRQPAIEAESRARRLALGILLAAILLVGVVVAVTLVLH